ncbi:MAG: 2-dehydropantoate 2-reductase [Anaerolineales bacterium]|nr:2-dehydropantoate 2-reductase [Anaerolineales bacterium]MDW8446000.1 2-dehydropantoate 2-reductase [Anaerolineales bacterium]
MSQLKILIIGAGALGSYLGGRLMLAGQRVVFLGKAAVAQVLAEKGLSIHYASKLLHIQPIEVTSSLDQALLCDVFDLILVVIKAYDTPSLIDSLKPFKEHLPPILVLQNGVENEDQFRSCFGKEQVIAGTVTSAISRKETGEIVVEKERGIGIATENEFSRRLIQVFRQAGFRVKGYPRAADMKWSKLITNQLVNASCAILGMTPRAVLSHPASFRLEMLQIRETLTVMNAHKIYVTDLPATPVRLLAWSIRSLPLWLSRPLLGRFVAKGRGNKMPSLYLDLKAGKRQSEVDALNGAVVRFGERVHLPTPANRFLWQTLNAMIQGTIPLDAFRYSPQKLLEAYLLSS